MKRTRTTPRARADSYMKSALLRIGQDYCSHSPRERARVLWPAQVSSRMNMGLSSSMVMYPACSHNRMWYCTWSGVKPFTSGAERRRPPSYDSKAPHRSMV